MGEVVTAMAKEKKAKIAAPPHRSHKVTCKGGPWHGAEAWFPSQDLGDPLSLPLCVGEWRGRYNLNDGRWVPTIDPRDDK